MYETTQVKTVMTSAKSSWELWAWLTSPLPFGHLNVCSAAGILILSYYLKSLSQSLSLYYFLSLFLSLSVWRQFKQIAECTKSLPALKPWAPAILASFLRGDPSVSFPCPCSVLCTALIQAAALWCHGWLNALAHSPQPPGVLSLSAVASMARILHEWVLLPSATSWWCTSTGVMRIYYSDSRWN